MLHVAWCELGSFENIILAVEQRLECDQRDFKAPDMTTCRHTVSPGLRPPFTTHE